MDQFERIDMQTWNRAELYKLYTEQWPTTTYSVTKKLKCGKFVAYLHERGMKFVPSMIWLVSRAVNEVENYRLALREGALGRWNIIHPLFPTLNSEKNMTFHSLAFCEDFNAFYLAYLEEQRENIAKTCLWATSVPENFFMVSVLPFLHFEGSSMQLKNAKGYFAPFVAIGQYDAEKNLPCMIMGNHAGTDAWHVSEVFNRIQAGMDDPAAWCTVDSVKGV